MNIYETLSCGSYEVLFRHPDTGVEIHTICIEDMHLETEDDDSYETELRDKIWNMFDPAYYYHEMILTSKYIFDGFMYEHTMNCTKYTIETEPVKRYKLVEAPFQK